MAHRLGDTVPILAVRAPDATQASGVVEWMRYTGGKTASLAETPSDKSGWKRNDGDAAIKWSPSSSGLKRKRNSDAASKLSSVIPLRPESADVAPPNRNSPKASE
ncbi:hypothetical protein C8R44DRAFT_753231 [Mycena epipterygia]|nr:hypothetical protein C8R44DRAFT_753231 [Mycena epipterygia]